jgi:hypothetical protein
LNLGLLDRQIRARSTRWLVIEAALQVPCRLNVGNLCNTGRLTEPAPPAALADEPAVAFPASIAALMKLTFA